MWFVHEDGGVSVPYTSGTFTYNNAAPATITRATGSFLTDGWVPRQKCTISGTASNNKVVTIRDVTSGTMTLSVVETLTQENNRVSSLTIDTEKLTRIPATGVESLEVLTGITNADVSGVAFDNYVTDAGFPGDVKIPAGTWNFIGNFSATNVSCTAKFEVCTKSADGLTTTSLFVTQPTTGLTTSVVQYTIPYTVQTDIPILNTDRIVVRVLGFNSAVNLRNMGWVYQGNTRASYVDTTFSILGVSGYSGASGASGFSGASGTSGTSGFSGASGTSGFSGSGISGFSGASGASGTSGFSGASGTSGFSGSGISGFSGVSGFSGSGISGFSGASGTSGFSGASGKSGFSGSGISGFSGSGISGFSGVSGFSGSGISGFSGVSGFSGSGISGFSGASGTSGFSGSGISGFSGASGAGTSGFSGVSGATGAGGTSGTSGFSGASGASGTSGTSGIFGSPRLQLLNTSATLVLDKGAYDEISVSAQTGTVNISAALNVSNGQMFMIRLSAAADRIINYASSYIDGPATRPTSAIANHMTFIGFQQWSDGGVAAKYVCLAAGTA